MIPKVNIGQQPSILPNILKHSKELRASGKTKLNNISLTSAKLNNMMQMAQFSSIKKICLGSLCDSSSSHGIDNLSGDWC